MCFVHCFILLYSQQIFVNKSTTDFFLITNHFPVLLCSLSLKEKDVSKLIYEYKQMHPAIFGAQSEGLGPQNATLI